MENFVGWFFSQKENYSFPKALCKFFFFFLVKEEKFSEETDVSHGFLLRK